MERSARSLALLAVLAGFSCQSSCALGPKPKPTVLRCFQVPGCLPLAPEKTPNTIGYTVDRVGWVNPKFRDEVLAPRWSTLAGQNETASCITKWSVDVSVRFTEYQGLRLVHLDSAFRVWEDSAANIKKASPQRIDFDCGPGVPTIHVHPPHSCFGSPLDRENPANCIALGWEAFQCRPSPDDWAVLARVGAPFSLIQCGPNQVVFYFLAERPRRMFLPDSVQRLIRTPR